MKSYKTTRIAVVADVHAPFHDNKAVDLACEVIQDFSPNIGIHLGDGCDFYAVSVFNKNPIRVLKLQEELDSSFDVNSRLASASKANWFYINGNHEARWQKYINDRPELFSLEGLKLETLLRLDELGWASCDSYLHQKPRILLTHGKRVSKHPSRAVANELLDRLFQVNTLVIGHGHRTGSYIISGCGNTIRGYEVGCLCDLAPNYRAVNNWSQSILLFTIIGDTISAEQVIFQDKGRIKSAIWRDKKYTVK